MRTIYICEFCQEEYDNKQDATDCENRCRAEQLGLESEEYEEYIGLLKEELDVCRLASHASNNKILKRCDDAIKAVLDFERKHNIKI